MCIMTNNNVFTMKTVQIGPVRTLLTALKDIILETNIIISPEGIKIINMDKTHTILVHLDLPSENFEFYECKKDKIIIAVNTFHLFKFINMIDNDDTLTMYIDNTDYQDGVVSYLSLKYENGAIKQCRDVKLKLLEPEQDELEVPDVKFSSIINLPSADFQKIIRDSQFISDRLDLKTVGNDVFFSCEGQIGVYKIRRTEDDESMKFISKSNLTKVIQGEFSLKNLSYCIKCTSLCPQIELYLENDLPLVIKYDVASLGTLKLGLVPLPSI